MKSKFDFKKVLQPKVLVLVVAVVVAAVGVVTVVNAFSGSAFINIENVQNAVFGGGVETPSLGAYGDTNFTSLVLSGDLTVGDAVTVSGATDVSTFTQGGGVTASSTSNSSETLLASDFDTENYIEYTPNVSSVTLTLPATSTLSSFIPNAGDSRSIILENATTTAGINITIAAGTGMDLQVPDGQNVIIGPNNYAILTFYRRSDTDMVVVVDETIPAD